MNTAEHPGEAAVVPGEDQDIGPGYLSESDVAVTDEVCNDEGHKEEALVAILTRLHDLLGCVPPAVQEVVARRLAVPAVTVQEVVSFDEELSARPRPGGVARLCGGAACLAPHGLGSLTIGGGAGGSSGAALQIAPCLAACWAGPVAELGSVRYEHVSPEVAHELVTARHLATGRARQAQLRGVPTTPWRREELAQIRARLGERVGERLRPAPHAALRELLVCNGSACSRDLADRVAEALSRSLAERGLDRRVRVVRVGCCGEDLGKVTITACPGGWRVRGADERRAADLVAALDEGLTSPPPGAAWVVKAPAAPAGVLRRCGCVDPCSLEEYIASGGFTALERTLATAAGRTWGLRVLQSSGLRARDGEGELLAERFAAAEQARAEVVLCPCVCSEAHLPADALLLGGDPFSVIEGVTLAGVLSGARRGIVMPPPTATHVAERVELAVALARRRGLLGSTVLGAPFLFDIRVIPAPRRLVAADDSALRRLLLGRGPLKPASRSAAANGPRAVFLDPESAARLAGVLELEAKQAGEGVALAARRLVTVTGSAVAPGVLDVPFAATLSQILDMLCWDRGDTRAGVKGVLSGGLLGVFAAASSAQAGVAARGSLLVLDEATCVAELVANMLTTLAHEACGGCAPGRAGVRLLRDLWAQVAAGRGSEETLALIHDTAAHVDTTARCALGRGAARMVISALATFADEVASHLLGGRCPARSRGSLADGP